jgi:hypothetical protein
LWLSYEEHSRSLKSNSRHIGHVPISPTYVVRSLQQLCMGLKLGLSQLSNNTGWKCSRTGCWQRYLDLRKRNKQKACKNCIMRSWLLYSLPSVCRRTRRAERAARMGRGEIHIGFW